MISNYLFFVLLAFGCCCQPGERTGLQVDYPGHQRAFDTATLFAPGVVSTDAVEHSAPAVSPDGKTMLWSVISLSSWRSRILEINYVNGQWTTPQIASFSDTSSSYIYPFFSSGRGLYFSSDRKLPSGNRTSRGNVLWRVEKTEAGWSTPHPLDSIISRGGDYAPTLSTIGNLYFSHGPFRAPDWNIFVSRNNQASESLAVINSDGYEDGAYISPDESYLIFESDRPGGVDGSIDLYIAFKGEDNQWTKPVNMGPKINTSASERFASVSRDGKFLFFGSNRRLVDGNPNFDIYWINASVIDELR